MADEEKQEAVSPTGKALVSAKLTPYFAAAAAVCIVVAGSSMADLGLSPKVGAWATLLAAVFATLAGLTPGLRKVVLIFAFIGLTNCATVDVPLISTGEVIDTASKEYQAVVGLMSAAHKAKLITDDQFHQWRLFSDHFEVTYELAIKIWENARSIKDDTVAEQAAAIIKQLGKELTVYKGDIK